MLQYNQQEAIDDTTVYKSEVIQYCLKYLFLVSHFFNSTSAHSQLHIDSCYLSSLDGFSLGCLPYYGRKEALFVC